jgi:stage II sporulation protein D
MLDGAAVDDPDGVKFRSNGLVRCVGQAVRGQIEVRRGQTGLVAINVLPLEDYLAAVLGSEMSPSFPFEALKAQAVAARTYAVQRKIEAWGRPYHLGATVLHQVYAGVKQEDRRTREAVEATRGEVMTHHMAPIEAYFHSSCGGRTESGLEALGRSLSYLASVVCPCGETLQTAWSGSFVAADFKGLLAGSLSDVTVLERTPTGRARRVQLLSSSGKRIVTGGELRRTVGYLRLKSLSFESEGRGPSVRLTGKGFGHGAGLCQWGAKAYAEKGWDYRRILDHYYTGAELKRMY